MFRYTGGFLAEAVGSVVDLRGFSKRKWLPLYKARERQDTNWLLHGFRVAGTLGA
jgi:hypothetical protein